MSSRRRVLVLVLGAILALFGPPLPTAYSVADDVPVTSATFNGPVEVAVASGSVIYVGGGFTRARDTNGTVVTRRHLAAVDAQTGRLLSWRPSANGAVHSLAVTRHQVFAGGNFTRVNGQPRTRLVKIGRARAGRVLRTPRSFAANAPVFALAVGHRRLYAGGAFTRAAGRPRDKLAAFHLPSARLVGGWTPSASGGVRVLRVTQRRVYVAGGFSGIDNRRASGRLAAVAPASGRVIRAFNPRIRVTVYDVRVAGRRVYAVGAGTGGHVWALNGRGGSIWTRQLDGDARGLALLRGDIYVGGHFTHVCATQRVDPNAGDCLDPRKDSRRKLAAFDTAGRLTPWTPSVNSRDGVFTVTSSSVGGTVAVGGMFSGFQRPDAAGNNFALFRATQ